MPSKKTLSMVGATLAVVCGFLTASALAFAASTEKVLYSFCSANDCTDGNGPGGGLIFDAAGNLYGTTRGGGTNTSACSGFGCGTVFQLTPGTGGTWTENVLYSFCSADSCSDGIAPQAGLVLDAAGKLYGTTAGGGTGTGCSAGCGTVFELSPNEDGTWTETVLHDFAFDGKDGFQPLGGLTFDASGNLYGAAREGGAHGGGIVFELTPGSNGTWTETVLYNFCTVGSCRKNGMLPVANVVFGNKGTLYGTTTGGGILHRPCGYQGCGVVFQLKPGAGGKWKETVLHEFSSRGGSQAGLILDGTGNLYGTTPGTVFELKKNDGWTEKVLHTFTKRDDGSAPSGSLVFDRSGNLYGTTFDGGAHHTCLDGSGCGTVFRLTRQSNWKETILHSFTNNGVDGTVPGSGVIFDTNGNLYGTTAQGGTGPCENSINQVVGCGTVFEITP